jgi:multicomponent Na+:H+ antiporter subunit F
VVDRVLPLFVALQVALCLLAVYRGVRGPHAEDRVVAMNVVATNTILIVAALARLSDSYMFLDVALVYALCSFLATVAILKGLRKGRLS